MILGYKNKFNLTLPNRNRLFYNQAQTLTQRGMICLICRNCRMVVIMASASWFGGSCEGSRGGQAASYPGGWRDGAELLREPDGSCGLETENSQWWVLWANINIAVRWFTIYSDIQTLYNVFIYFICSTNLFSSINILVNLQTPLPHLPQQHSVS